MTMAHVPFTRPPGGGWLCLLGGGEFSFGETLDADHAWVEKTPAGTIGFLPETTPVEITPAHVVLMCTPDGQLNGGAPIIHETDFVLLNTGFRGDQGLLEMAGVELRGENRAPVFDPATMETTVPGIYLAGTVAAGIQQCYSLFIENCHEHAGKIVQAITGHWPEQLGDAASRNYRLSFEQIEAN